MTEDNLKAMDWRILLNSILIVLIVVALSMNVRSQRSINKHVVEYLKNNNEIIMMVHDIKLKEKE